MLVLKSSYYSLRVPIQLGTTVLDRAMARITVEELAHASNTWQQTYMSTMVTTKVASMVEMKNDDILTIDAPLVTTKPTGILPFECKHVKGLVGSLPAHSYQVNIIVELIESHQITGGVMATNTYGDLHPGSRRVGMMLRNLPAQDIRRPPKTVISNVQAAEIVLNMKAPKQTSEVLPSMEQTEPSWVSQPTCLNPPKLS